MQAAGVEDRLHGRQVKCHLGQVLNNMTVRRWVRRTGVVWCWITESHTHCGAVRPCEHRKGMYVCLFVALRPATAKVISGQVPTCNSVHLWQLYSAAPLENQATSTMT